MLLVALGQLLPAQVPIDVDRPCRSSSPVVWHSVAPPGDRDLLNRWCDSVGPPLTMSGAPPPPSLTTLVIATWNVHAGNGDVEAFLASLAKLPGVHPPYGVVLLLQEAVRAGVEVPERYPDLMRPPRGIRARRREYEVASLGERLALHVAYVPSMRNGRLFPSDAREDRGNAILSTLPLSDLRAIELPFGRQRRVVVAAQITVPGLPPFQVMTVHLDASGHRTEEARALAAFLPGLVRKGESLVVGGDLNTWFARREDALKTLSAAVRLEDCGHDKTNTWPWQMQWPFGWWRGRLDYLFSTLPSEVGPSCQTIPQQFGSDHRPVVLVIPIRHSR